MRKKHLEFIWILNPQGKIYIQRVFNRKQAIFDANMFSNIINTLSSFSTSVFSSSFDELSFGDKIVFTKGYPEFQVILSTKKAQKGNKLHNLVEEVGEAFRLQYWNILQGKDEIDIRKFDKFSSIIDMMYDMETYIYLEEQ